MSELLFETIYKKAKANVIICLDGDAWENAVKLYHELNGGDLYDKIKILKLLYYNKIMDLKKIAQEIRDILSERQKEFQITFEEESHKYTMLDDKGNLRSDFPSVSKVMKLFYEEFPTEQAAYSKAGGDPDEAERLMEEWAEKQVENQLTLVLVVTSFWKNIH